MAKDHVNNCPEMEMICSHCNEKVKRGDTALHSDRCVMKEVNCICRIHVRQKDMDAHKEDSCSWKKISCPLNCKNMIERFVFFLSFLDVFTNYKKKNSDPLQGVLVDQYLSWFAMLCILLVGLKDKFHMK